jgi:hypothetical protein
LKGFCEKSLIDFVNSVVIPCGDDTLAERLGKVGKGYAAEPDDGVLRICSFEREVHQAEYLQDKGLGKDIIFDTEQLDSIRPFEKYPPVKTEYFGSNYVDGTTDEKIAVSRKAKRAKA